MKCKVTFLCYIFILVDLSNSYSQEKTKQELFKPFTILIIKPETARIADSLKVYADSIEKRHREKYFSLIKNLEKNYLEMKEHQSYEEGEKIRLRIQELKSKESELNNFKYYDIIAEKTLRELGTLFNSNYFSIDNILSGEVIDPSSLVTHDLDILRKHFKSSYIVTFENIHTDKKNGVLILRYVTTLFSRKEGQVILKKEIEGNAPVENFKALDKILPQGLIHETSINCENYLECAFISAIRFSTEDLFNSISSRQKK